MARLVLGPLLRFASETQATIWVEADAPCEVEALGTRTRTFAVEGRHYALLCLEGLEPGTRTEYAVALDGERVWPQEGSGLLPSAIPTLPRAGPIRILFGSCRVAAPNGPPYTLRKGSAPQAVESDALRAFAEGLARGEEERPHALLMLGDQVYADELSPGVLALIRNRRDVSQPPGEEVADFEEYTVLYRESWSEPLVRWLLSTVPSAMVFDDHDVHDDWNISASWVRDARARPWWEARIEGAFMSYWIYQHLGNLSPQELARDELFARVREVDDAGPLLRDFARRADRTTDGAQWSYRRDFGRSRLVVVDSRAGRVLGEGRRSMVDDDEWRFVTEPCEGELDHLLLASSLPFFLPRGTHGLEAASERVCAGSRGAWAARRAERVRRALDLEHWAAFERSFRALERLLGEVAARETASIVGLSGDIHHSYLARVDVSGARCPVYQAVVSPFRNPLTAQMRRVARFAASPLGSAIGRVLELLGGARAPGVRWRLEHGPWFDNVLGTLVLEGRSAVLRIERSGPSDGEGPRLGLVFEHRIAD